MKRYVRKIEINTKKPNEFVDITDRINSIIKESGIKDGMVFVNSIHNTATVLIQENDSTIFQDMKELFDRILPPNKKYHHDYEGGINATAHLKTNLVGQTISLPLYSGKLVLGTWQRVFFVEWFEPRRRSVLITIMGE